MSDSMANRGRTRDRGSTLPIPRTKERSTRRGRSRQRASSPTASRTTSPSPSIMSPSRHHLYNRRLRDNVRREHCPSRPTSPSRLSATSTSPLTAPRRARSRRRSPAPLASREPLKPLLEHQNLSGLRNEVLAEESDEDREEQEGVGATSTVAQALALSRTLSEQA